MIKAIGYIQASINVIEGLRLADDASAHIHD
jgi:hypothetical protein